MSEPIDAAQQVRLECLRIAAPRISAGPDEVIKTAAMYERFVVGNPGRPLQGSGDRSKVARAGGAKSVK